MKRRDFLRHSVPVSTIPFLLGGYSLKAYGAGPLLQALVGSRSESDHVLVLIQMNGGNDGINMVIPRDQYSALMNARGNIAIAENLVLPLTEQTGLHPAMTGLHKAYSNGQLAVVQSVGYPNPNFSHFRATDIWLTASNSSQVLSSGWMGRYLDQEYPNFPVGYPNPVSPDPLAIQIGSVISSGLQGPTASMGMAITSATSFYQLVSGGIDTAPSTPAGHELTFLRQVAQQTQQYATVITSAASKASNKSSLYPAAGQNSLADQLKIVAQLIAGGLKTRIYVVNINGFDTHSSQVDSAQTEVGAHAILLGKLSDAIAAFLDDIRLLRADHRVIGMTFSEFGRRIKSNASFGTDHGAAAPMLLFGRRIRNGVIGTNPVIPPSVTVNDNIPMQYDFRSVYASVLREWFHVSDAELNAVLLQNFQTLSLVQPVQPKAPVVSGEASPGVPGRLSLSQNYPNPFNPSTRIGFSTDGGKVELRVFDTAGREIRTLVDGVYPAGEHEVHFDGTGLPSGLYYYRLQSGAFQEVKSMMLVK